MAYEPAGILLSRWDKCRRGDGCE